MRQILPVLNIIGLVIIVFTLTFSIPLGVSITLEDSGQAAFMWSMVLASALGGVLWLLTRKYRREMKARDGFLLVFACWTILPAIASIPFMIYYQMLGEPISFSFAYFEAASGLTTTGATVLTGLDALPPSLNVWRGTIIWIGGMGILVLAVAILPLLGVGGQQIVKAEMPGPLKDDKLAPTITGTAKGLYGVYMCISAVCFLSFYMAGMSPVDAYVHMGTVMALGGFSSHDASMAYFASGTIDAIGIFFMLVAGVNFGSHFLAFRRRSFRPYLANAEALLFLSITLGSAIAISLYLYIAGVYTDFMDALRYGVFNTISVATTTGLSNTDYLQWPIAVPVLMLLLSCFVSSAGSTGGGVKLIRIIIVIKQIKRDLMTLVHPQSIYKVRLGHRVVSDRVVSSVQAYLALYVSSIVILSILLLISGLDIDTSFSAIVACINSTGPGLGDVGPAGNYSGFNSFQIWVCTTAMILGRLELFTIFVLFTRAFWHK